MESFKQIVQRTEGALQSQPQSVEVCCGKGVDPRGDTVGVIGLSTFESDSLDVETVKEAVVTVGYLKKRYKLRLGESKRVKIKS